MGSAAVQSLNIFCDQLEQAHCSAGICTPSPMTATSLVCLAGFTMHHPVTLAAWGGGYAAGGASIRIGRKLFANVKGNGKLKRKMTQATYTMIKAPCWKQEDTISANVPSFLRKVSRKAELELKGALCLQELFKYSSRYSIHIVNF